MDEYLPKELKNKSKKIDMCNLWPSDEDIRKIRYKNSSLYNLEDWDY